MLVRDCGAPEIVPKAVSSNERSRDTTYEQNMACLLSDGKARMEGRLLHAMLGDPMQTPCGRVGHSWLLTRLRTVSESRKYESTGVSTTVLHRLT